MQAIQALGGVKLQWDRNQPWKVAGPFRKRDTPFRMRLQSIMDRVEFEIWRRRRIITTLTGIIDRIWKGSSRRR